MTPGGDPALDYDAWCARREAERLELVRHATCRDCMHCRINPRDDSDFGWCVWCEDWAELSDSVEGLGCEDFE